MMFKKMVVSAIVLSGLGIMASKIEFYRPTPTTYVATSEEAMEFKPTVVLELFTSQGCSSCPPADALLEKVKNEFENLVIPISYHVDYWNYIGWEDPFSDQKYAEKQNAYNIKFKNRSNYTPQLVVNGKEHFVGSNTAKVYASIEEHKKRETENKIEISKIREDSKSILFRYTIAGAINDKVLRALLVLDKRTTRIKRGENRNKILTNSNIVVAEKYIATKGSESESFITIPEIVKPDEKISLVLVLETKDHDITAAAKKLINR